MYLPVAIGGYVVKGFDVSGNILLGVDTSVWWIKAAIVMEILNLLGTYIITCNPVSQVFEDQLNIPKSTCLFAVCVGMSGSCLGVWMKIK